jgi:hypothetical protein
MTNDANFSPPRKKRNILWWLAGFFLLLLCIFLVQLFGPNPPIAVSPQTTYITEPLGPDGLPDYEKYVLKIGREGATAENNAAVLLWQALGAPDIPFEDQAVVAAEIGLKNPPQKEEVLQPLYNEKKRMKVAAWLHQQGKLRFSDRMPDKESIAQVLTMKPWPLAPEADHLLDVVDNVIDQTMDRPWTSSEIPPLADWVAENKKSLDLIVEASRRTRYYMPSASLLDSQHDSLVGLSLGQIQTSREAARSLMTRAMWNLGENRPLDAWQDLLAIHRLARLLTQGHTLTEQLVAIAIDGMACEGDATLLNDSRLTLEQARQIERDLIAIPNFAVVARSIDKGERIIALDTTFIVSRDARGLFQNGGSEKNTLTETAINVTSVDWNLVLREINRWYDRLVTAASLPDHAARAAAFAKFSSDLQLLDANSQSLASLLGGALSRRQRSQLVSVLMINFFLPAVTAASDAEDRANTFLELERLAAALAVYRAKHGHYPAKLADLIPDPLAKSPTDIYNAKPFLYQQNGDSYLLYSAGENGVDDGGSHESWKILKGQSLYDLDDSDQQKQATKIPVGADDISIRATRPHFTLPNVKSSNGAQENPDTAIPANQ